MPTARSTPRRCATRRDRPAGASGSGASWCCSCSSACWSGRAKVAYDWSQTQYYVAVSDGRVAIYRGIQSDLPGIDLQDVERTTGITIESLPDYTAQQVRSGIPADSEKHAQDIVADLTGLAKVCPTPEPEPTQDPTQQEARRQEARPALGVRRRPTPSPSPTIAPPDCIETGDSATDEPSPSASPGASPEASPGAEVTP